MRNIYESPLSGRYASAEMLELFSPDTKFRTWRKLWIALARAEMKLGLPVTAEQVAELESMKDDINYAEAEKREKEVRHDVMSHVYAYGLQCPNAKGIIHLGATSCYVCDNTDLIIMRDAMKLIRQRLVSVISALSKFADEYKDMPTLGFTHYQPAQLTTVGKRATLWINELLYDLSELEFRIDAMRLLGSKGTTGTQASFMELFDGDEAKIKKMEEYIAEELGFDGVVLTDMALGQNAYMSYDALTKGPDLFLDPSGAQAQFDEYASSPTFRQSVRKAVHRYLYVVVNGSAAMNGVSSASEIVSVTPWWQMLLTALQICFFVIGDFSSVMVVMILKKESKAEKMKMYKM